MIEKAEEISGLISHFVDKPRLRKVKRFFPTEDGTEGPAKLLCLLLGNSAFSLHH